MTAVGGMYWQDAAGGTVVFQDDGEFVTIVFSIEDETEGTCRQLGSRYDT